MKDISYVVDTKHIKHKTWSTRVTVGSDPKSYKEFGLRSLDQKNPEGPTRVYTPFGGSSFKDFDTRTDAIAHCQAT
jgi:hypothetical protein